MRTFQSHNFNSAEGTWQWASGDPWGFETWHEGEPNNVDNEVSDVIDEDDAN